MLHQPPSGKPFLKWNNYHTFYLFASFYLVFLSLKGTQSQMNLERSKSRIGTDAGTAADALPEEG